jgi:hypothetical protein
LPAIKVESFLVATAQVEAWVGARKGSIHEAARVIDLSLADAALGRMMLHRRRAVAASVISSFFARVGTGYAPYLEGRSSVAPLDPGSERAIAAYAGELAASFCGMSPPLAFERALLAESEQRSGDALADLKQVLNAYPGFVPGAIAAGRTALAAGDPEEAIRLLAPVEGEITHTRDGAALLADAARAIGLHESASRYDLAAAICRGGYDSYGNDCAPIDLTGKIVDDERMPQSLYLEGQADGSVICNAGAIYYNVNPFVGHLLTVVSRGRRLSTMRSLGPSAPNPQKSAIAEIFDAAIARLRLFLGGRFPIASFRLPRYFVSAWSGLRRFLAAVFRLAAKIDLALVVFLYRLYRHLPVPVRASANKVVQSLMAWLRPLVRDTIGPQLGPRGSWRLFSPISDPHRRGQLAEARYHLGLARIFGMRPLENGTEATPRGAAFLEQRLSAVASPPPDEVALKMPAPGKLPPLAEDVLRRLIGEADIGRAAPPPS